MIVRIGDINANGTHQDNEFPLILLQKNTRDSNTKEKTHNSHVLSLLTRFANSSYPGIM